MLDSYTIKVFSKTGNFLRNISLKEYGELASSIEFFDNKLFISSQLQYGANHDWIVLDTLGNLLKMKLRTIPQFTSNNSSQSRMYKFENRIYQWSPYSDTVFSIAPDLSYKPIMIINPGEHRLPKSDFRSIEEIKRYFQPHYLMETTHFLIIRYYWDNKVTIALIDKKNNKPYLEHLKSGGAALGSNLIGGIFNDLDSGVRFQPENYFEEGNREYLVGLINAFQITALLGSEEFRISTPKLPEKKQELEKLAKSIIETDNQILMIIRLKK